MPDLSITTLGTAQAKGTGTSLVSPSSFTPVVGDYLIAVIAADTDGVGTLSLTSGGYTVGTTSQITATNSGNVVTSVNYARVTAIGSGSSTITLSGLTTGDSKAVSFYKFGGLAESPLDKNSVNTGSSSTPSSGATETLIQPDQIILGAIGTEGPDGDAAGSWTTGTNNVSGNEQRLGTTGSAAAGNITISTAAEIISSFDAQTAEKTGIDSRDWAAVIVTFKKEIIDIIGYWAIDGTFEKAF